MDELPLVEEEPLLRFWGFRLENHTLATVVVHNHLVELLITVLSIPALRQLPQNWSIMVLA